MAAADTAENAPGPPTEPRKQHRAIATRYEKLAAHYAVLILIGCILLWL